VLEPRRYPRTMQANKPLTLIIQAYRSLAWGSRRAAQWILILGSGDDGGPAGGPGGRGFHGPRGSFLDRRDGFRTGQGACAWAVIRFQAVTIAGAQGQVAAIFRRRRRPLAVRRAAVCRMR
jgi:hypothetical protein